jgi:hypothetical protein
MRRIVVGSQPGQIVHETLSLKYPIQNRTGEGVQVIQPLPNMSEALSSNPGTDKKKSLFL